MKINRTDFLPDWVMKLAQTIPMDGFADGGEAYTDDEMDLMKELDAQKLEDEKVADTSKVTDPDVDRRRDIRVELSDGDYTETWINGTVRSIIDYYFHNPFPIPQDYDGANPNATRTVTKIVFLG